MCHLQGSRGHSTCKVEGDPFATFNPGKTRADPDTGLVKDDSMASRPSGPVSQLSEGGSSRPPTIQPPSPSRSVPDGQASDEVPSHSENEEVEAGNAEDMEIGKNGESQGESGPAASTDRPKLWSDFMVSPTSTLETLVPPQGSRPLLPLVTRYWIESHDHYEDIPKEALIMPTTDRPTGPLEAWRCVSNFLVDRRFENRRLADGFR